MRMLLYLICLFVLARKVSGFDPVKNNSKYFCLKNNQLARVLLPKYTGYRTTRKLRSKADFCKMTYFGLASYISAVVLVILYFCLSFCVSPIYVNWDITITLGDSHNINTLNDILPMLLMFMVISVVIAYSLYMEYKFTKRGRISTWLYYIIFVFFGISELMWVSLLVKLFLSV